MEISPAERYRHEAFAQELLPRLVQSLRLDENVHVPCCVAKSGRRTKKAPGDLRTIQQGERALETGGRGAGRSPHIILSERASGEKTRHARASRSVGSPPLINRSGAVCWRTTP